MRIIMSTKWINRTVGDPTDRNGGQIYEGKKNIATVHYGSEITIYEAIQNARLIASAPEMAAEIETLRAENAKLRGELSTAANVLGLAAHDFYLRNLEQTSAQYKAAMERARAALARVKGESHE